MLIKGMQGLGDNIYQRAFVRQLSGEVWLETAWPQLYADLPHVRPVNPNTGLRTQARNAAAFQGYVRPPAGKATRHISYADRGMIVGMRGAFGVDPGPFDLPDFGPAPLNLERYVVVRPATIRSEWRADSRNPRGDYIARAAARAQDEGFKVVSIADLQPQREWLVGEEPPADIVLHRGELAVEELLALTQNAAGVIGGVGWIYPAAVAQQRPLLCFFGGFGGYNTPAHLAVAGADMSRIVNAVPAPQCLCRTGQHQCENKDIPDANQAIERFVDLLHQPDLVAQTGDGVRGRAACPV